MQNLPLSVHKNEIDLNVKHFCTTLVLQGDPTAINRLKATLTSSLATAQQTGMQVITPPHPLSPHCCVYFSHQTVPKQASFFN